MTHSHRLQAVAQGRIVPPSVRRAARGGAPAPSTIRVDDLQRMVDEGVSTGGWEGLSTDRREAPGTYLTTLAAMLRYFFTLVKGPRRFVSLKLSDATVYEPQIRAHLGTTAHF